MFKENFKYKLLTALRYLGDGFFYPFFSLYLVTRGLTEARIGFILGISPLLAIIMNPIYSKLCNNVKKVKITLGIISILEGLIILTIGFSKDFYLISALTILMSIFGSCHYGLMNSLVAVYSDKTKQNYSGIRMYGSAAYIIATATGGYICKVVSYQLAFGLSCALFIISGILYLLLHNIEVDEAPAEEKKSDFKDYKVILKNKSYIFFAVFYAVINALVITGTNFLPTYLETRGVDSDGYGLVYAYFVLFEVIFLIILNKVKIKASAYTLMILASLTLIIRIIPCYFDAPVWVIISLSAFRGIGYAIILHVCFQNITKALGEEKATKGIMLATLLYSILLFTFNNVNGILIESFGYKTFHLVNLIASILLVIYTVFISIYNRNLEKEYVEENNQIIDEEKEGENI
ncbi:MAG: MFS transporter [Acholeplasmatales bacterium]|nr:MFS transporter [Acholeplasmatales bacterium]